MSIFSYPRRISIPNFCFLHWVFRYEKPSCHLCLDRGFRRYWSFLIGIVKFNLGMNMISYPRRFSVPNFSFLHWILRRKELSCPYCLDWGCGGCWRFLIGVWNLNQGVKMLSYPRRISVPNFSFLHWVWRCNELSYPYCLNSGGWWRLQIGVGISIKV